MKLNSFSFAENCSDTIDGRTFETMLIPTQRDQIKLKLKSLGFSSCIQLYPLYQRHSELLHTNVSQVTPTPHYGANLTAVTAQ